MNGGIWLSGWAFLAFAVPVMFIASIICIAGYRQAQRSARAEQRREDLLSMYRNTGRVRVPW